MTLHNKSSLCLTENDSMKILMEKLENGTFHSTLFYSLIHMFTLRV